MKLFVWIDPYRVSYGSSLFFAVAETVEAARDVAARSKAYAYGNHEQSAPPGVELGEPARIVDLPCGEWHEWSE